MRGLLQVWQTFFKKIITCSVTFVKWAVDVNLLSILSDGIHPEKNGQELQERASIMLFSWKEKVEHSVDEIANWYKLLLLIPDIF